MTPFNKETSFASFFNFPCRGRELVETSAELFGFRDGLQSNPLFRNATNVASHYESILKRDRAYAGDQDVESGLIEYLLLFLPFY